MAFWQELFCVIRVPMKVFSVNAPITHMNCLGINFPIAHTSVTQKNCFRIICVIISGRALCLSLSLVNLFLLKLVRISGLSSLLLAIAVFSAHFARERERERERGERERERAKNTAIAEKRRGKPSNPH